MHAHRLRLDKPTQARLQGQLSRRPDRALPSPTPEACDPALLLGRRLGRGVGALLVGNRGLALGVCLHIPRLHVLLLLRIWRVHRLHGHGVLSLRVSLLHVCMLLRIHLLLVRLLLVLLVRLLLVRLLLIRLLVCLLCLCLCLLCRCLLWLPTTLPTTLLTLLTPLLGQVLHEDRESALLGAVEREQCILAAAAHLCTAGRVLLALDQYAQSRPLYNVRACRVNRYVPCTDLQHGGHPPRGHDAKRQPHLRVGVGPIAHERVVWRQLHVGVPVPPLLSHLQELHEVVPGLGDGLVGDVGWILLHAGAAGTLCRLLAALPGSGGHGGGVGLAGGSPPG